MQWLCRRSLSVLYMLCYVHLFIYYCSHLMYYILELEMTMKGIRNCFNKFVNMLLHSSLVGQPFKKTWRNGVGWFDQSFVMGHWARNEWQNFQQVPPLEQILWSSFWWILGDIDVFCYCSLIVGILWWFWRFWRACSLFVKKSMRNTWQDSLTVVTSNLMCISYFQL